jgi:hypothetical protein
LVTSQLPALQLRSGTQQPARLHAVAGVGRTVREVSVKKHTQDEPRRRGLDVEAANTGVSQVGKIVWTIPSFAAQGVLLIVAEAGSGKTSLVYRAAEAIQEGTLFLHQIKARQGEVLVIQGDEPKYSARTKIRRMGIDASFSIAYPDPPLQLEELEKLIRSGEYTTIIIDSATSLLTMEKQETTDDSFVRLLYRINQLCVSNGVLAIITAHLNKPYDGQPRKIVTAHDISGRAGIMAAVTDVWAMWREIAPRWPDHYNLTCLGKRNCKQGHTWFLRGNEEDFDWELIESSDNYLPQEAEQLSEKVKSFCMESNEPQSLQEIATAVGTSYEVARRLCSDLFDQGQLQRQRMQTEGRGRPSYRYGIFPTCWSPDLTSKSQVPASSTSVLHQQPQSLRSSMDMPANGEHPHWPPRCSDDLGNGRHQLRLLD